MWEQERADYPEEREELLGHRGAEARSSEPVARAPVRGSCRGRPEQATGSSGRPRKPRGPCRHWSHWRPPRRRREQACAAER